MDEEILPVSAISNASQQQRRICSVMLETKGLIFNLYFPAKQRTPEPPLKSGNTTPVIGLKQETDDSNNNEYIMLSSE